MKQILQFSILLTGTLLITTSSFAKQIGVIAGTKDTVSIERSGKVIKARSGGALHQGDEIHTAADQPVQLILMDETVFTLGGDSHLRFDEFNYNADTQDGNLQIMHHKGTLKFSSGHISDGNPDSFKILLPNDAQIGVRGTLGTIAVLPPEQAQQQFPDQSNQISQPSQPVVFAALNGPGPSTHAGSGTGSFNFSSPDGSVDLNRPGGAVLATAGQPPVFFIAPPGAIQNISNGLNNDGNDGGSQNTAAQEGSGAESFDGSIDFVNANPPNTDISDLLFNANNNVDPSGFGTDTRAFGGTLQELVAVNSGSVSGSGSYTGTITGDFDFLINFANSTFDLQSYNLNGGGLNNDSIDVQGGSAALPLDKRTSLTVGNNGEDFAATLSGGCDSCSVTAIFPTESSISATVTNGGPSGTTGAIDF